MAKPTCKYCHRRSGRHFDGCDRPTFHRWTADDIELVRRLAEFGNSVSEIAAITGWPKGVLHHQCQRFGINTRWKELLWSKREDDFLRQNTGRGWIWCAEQLGRGLMSVHGRAKRLGIQKKQIGPDQMPVIRQLHAAGATTTVIGEHLGVTSECIRVTLKKMGLVANKRDENKKRESLRRTLAMRLQMEFSLLSGILQGKAGRNAD